MRVAVAASADSDKITIGCRGDRSRISQMVDLFEFHLAADFAEATGSDNDPGSLDHPLDRAQEFAVLALLLCYHFSLYGVAP